MSIAQLLLPELDQELASTRKTLERVPVDRFEWKPHPKSYTLGALATHIANLPTWINYTLRQTELNLETIGKITTLPASSQELLATFDQNVVNARTAVEAATDSEFSELWTLRVGSHTIFTLPRTAVYRSFVLNHLIHHRGQLTVYLRLNEIPVPGLYGPSADEA